MSDSPCRKPPRWTEPFLRALIRTGEVREAAKWAGVDFTTAYARRKKYADFAEQWDAALEARKRAVAEAEAAELRSLDRLGTNGMLGVDPSTSCAGSPPRDKLGEEFKVRRVNSARWSEAKERRFFDELVASANVRRAAEAAGVSSQAVYARRAKSAVFRRRWEQALANGRAAIEMGLVAEAKRSLDPDAMDLPAPEPRVSVSEAIKITQMNQGGGSAGGRGRGGQASFDEDDGEAHEQEMEGLRARLQTKLERLRERMIREEGFTVDEETDWVVPPGWIRDPDYVAKQRR